MESCAAVAASPEGRAATASPTLPVDTTVASASLLGADAAGALDFCQEGPELAVLQTKRLESLLCAIPQENIVIA